MDNGLFDYRKEYGLVLEGGGAKGAYQIGVWKALKECGVKIKGIAGVSVGALNGALICMGDYSEAENLWGNINYSSVMNLDDEQMELFLSGKVKDMSLQTVTEEGKRFLKNGGFDISPLKKLIEDNIDEKKIKESNMEFVVGTFSLSGWKELNIAADDVREGELKEVLLASANLPFFKTERILGQKLVDGGVVNNVPIDMLIKRGYKDIIVVRIFGPGVKKIVKVPEDVTVIEIAPKQFLCNVLEFDNRKALRNIRLGYYDALRILRSLAGIQFYIDQPKCEKEHMDRLLTVGQLLFDELVATYQKDGNPSKSSLRILTEEIYPKVAASFRMKKEWNYSSVYYAVIEYTAKWFKLKRYQVYTEDELLFFLKNEYLKKSNSLEETNIIIKLGVSIAINF